MDHAEDEYDRFLLNHSFWKFIRITCWISRFVNNWRTKTKEPLPTEETNRQLKYWIHREQHKHKESDKFKWNEQKLYEFQVRIEGHYPIYLPSKSTLSEKLIYQTHLKTIHGQVNQTTTHIRSDYWITTLRQVTKKFIKKCHTCKRFNTKTYPSPIQGQLLEDRTEQNLTFKVIEVDYDGPI